MASEDVQTNLRLPADLKDRLVASAAENNRSLSAEVSSRLEASYSAPDARKVLKTLSLLSDELETEKANVDIQRALAYRLASSLKFLVETGEMPTHTDKNPKVKPLMELVDETLKTHKDAFANAKARLDRQREKIERLQQEFEGSRVSGSAESHSDASTRKPKP